MAAHVVPFTAATTGHDEESPPPQVPVASLPHQPTKRPWHGLYNYRCKRLHDIPGWFDRWDFFAHGTRSSSSTGTTTGITTPATDAYCIVVWGIACHVSVLTTLVALLVFVSPIAHALHHTTTLGDIDNHVARLYLAVAAAVELLVLKLVLDRPRLRATVFTIYTTTIAVLVASVILAFHAPYAVLCLGVIASGWWIQYLLLVHRLQRGKNGSRFWNKNTIAIVRLLIVGGVLLGLLLFCEVPGHHNARNTFAVGVASELLLSSLAWVEVTLLCRTLAAQDAFLEVYFLHLDLLAGGIMQPVLYAGFMGLRAIVELCKWLWNVLEWLSFLPWMCVWFDLN